MQSIGIFFDKFKNVALKEMAVRQMILDSIVKHAGVPGLANDLTLKNIEVRNKVIRIRGSAALKNQIFIKKEAILKSIAEMNPHIVIIDLQ